MLAQAQSAVGFRVYRVLDLGFRVSRVQAMQSLHPQNKGFRVRQFWGSGLDSVCQGFGAEFRHRVWAWGLRV